MKSESFQEEEYPHLSRAMHHFKDTQKGRDEMCEIIEEYANEKANEKAVDTAIHIFLKLNYSKENIVKNVLEEFPQISEQQISKRVEELWDK